MEVRQKIKPPWTTKGGKVLGRILLWYVC